MAAAQRGPASPTTPPPRRSPTSSLKTQNRQRGTAGGSYFLIPNGQAEGPDHVKGTAFTEPASTLARLHQNPSCRRAISVDVKSRAARAWRGHPEEWAH